MTRAFFPLLLGQNPTPENHVKLHFTIGMSSGLRSAYIEALYICPHILVPFSCGTKSQLVSFSLDLKNCIQVICTEKSQGNLPGSCVLPDGTYSYWTGINVTCPVGSTLSISKAIE
jgi:hypothetical protein